MCFLHNPGRVALHSSGASERSPGYHGPAHAAPQRPLVAAARASPALSARPCQPFPRFLPPACDPLVAGTAGRAGTASFASLVSLRSPLPPGPLLLRARSYTPSSPALPRLTCTGDRRLESPALLSGNSSSPASCNQKKKKEKERKPRTSQAQVVAAAAGVAPPGRRS